MKATTDCVVCLFRQALNTARVATSDAAAHSRILLRLAAEVPHLSLDQTPAAMSKIVYSIVSEVTGVADPYQDLKRKTNEAALRVLTDLEQAVLSAPDALDAAVHLAVAGNIIDLGIGHAFDIDTDIRALMGQPFAIDALAQFRAELSPGKKVLYLGDNAGEIVFDRVLVERLLDAGLHVTFSVKSGPIINDATRADAEDCGLTSLVRVIETGSDDIGIHWDHISDEFRAAAAEADILIAKGHGNFETCCERPENFYFLLKAKCEVVARRLNVRCGDVVFQHGGV